MISPLRSLIVDQVQKLTSMDVSPSLFFPVFSFAAVYVSLESQFGVVVKERWTRIWRTCFDSPLLLHMQPAG